MDKILETLLAVIDQSSAYDYKDGGRWSFGSQRFEEETGVSGISHVYTMPEGRKPEEIFRDDIWKYQLITVALETAITAIEQNDKSLFNPRNIALEVKKRREKLPEIEPLSEYVPLGTDWDRVMAFKVETTALEVMLMLMINGVDFSADDLKRVLPQVKEMEEASCQNIYRQLVALNPELGKIGIDENDPKQVYHTVIGVLSYYNPQDIKFAVEFFAGEINDAEAGSVRAREAKIKAKTGTEMDWVPSPSTLRRIEQQLDRGTQHKR